MTPTHQPTSRRDASGLRTAQLVAAIYNTQILFNDSDSDCDSDNDR